MGPDIVYAQQVLGYGRRPESLLAISTSGSSTNVLNTVIVASALGLESVALTGASGGLVAEHATVTVRVPYDTTAMVQERHLPIYHSLCRMLEERFFPDESARG